MKLIYKALNIPLRILLHLTHPDMQCFLGILIPQVICVRLLLAYRVTIFLYPVFLLLTFVLTYISFGKFVEYDVMHENILVERVYAFFLKLYIENKNKYCFTQIPELYVNEKIEEYNEQFQKTMQDRKNKVKKEETRIPSFFDLEYEKELKFFGLYNRDFDLRDLKREKRNLVKLHHPDQFTDPSEQNEHRVLYDLTIRYYNTIVKNKKF